MGIYQSLLRELAGSEIPARLNVGICGLNSDGIDWEKVEYRCGELVARQGNALPHGSRQIVAMITASKAPTVAEAE